MQLSDLFTTNICKELVVATSSFILAFGVVLAQKESTTHVSLKLGMFLITLGFIFFIGLTRLLHKIFLATPYGLSIMSSMKLSVSDCVEISNKLISALQAILSCIFGFLVCTHSCRRNFLSTSHIFSESYAWFASSYFLYDLWSMFIVYVTKMYDNLKMKEIDWTLQDVTGLIPTKENGQLHVFRRIPMNKEEGAPKVPSFIDFMKKTKLMVFHHLFIGGYGLAVISSWRGGLGDCVFSFMYMMEASTPFVSFRAILSILGQKKSNLYVLNGLLMLLTFLIFRIIMLPVLLYKYSIIINMSFVSAILKLPLGCQISILALFIPQFYWFFLMIKIAVKMFIPPPPTNATTKEMNVNEINHNVNKEN